MYIVVTVNRDEPNGEKRGTSFVEEIESGINLLSFINRITHGKPADVFTFSNMRDANLFADLELERFEDGGEYMIADENNKYTVSKHNNPA